MDVYLNAATTKKVVYPWKRWITLIAGRAQRLPGEWEECIRVLRRREVIFFFSFGVSGTLAKTCWKPLFFYHVQQNQAKSAEKRGKTFYTSVIVKRKNESIGQRFSALCHLRYLRQYVQGHTRWDEPKAGAVRTAQRPVLAQQSCCFDALGAERAECNFSAPLWSTACWEGYGTEQVSVGPMKEASLWVEKQTCKIPFLSFPNILPLRIFQHRSALKWVSQNFYVYDTHMTGSKKITCKCGVDCSFNQRVGREKKNS